MSAAIAGLVLAGGRSSRMGGDKALLELGGVTLLQRAISRLAPQVGALAISANGDPASLAAGGLPVLADTMPGFRGPLAGILAGLQWTAAETACAAMVSAAVDTPFFPFDLVARLAEASAANADRIAVAGSGGRLHPVFALWPVAARHELERFLAADAKGKVMAFVEARGYVAVEFTARTQTAADAFFNVNTPAELDAARVMITTEQE